VRYLWAATYSASVTGNLMVSYFQIDISAWNVQPYCWCMVL